MIPLAAFKFLSVCLFRRRRGPGAGATVTVTPGLHSAAVDGTHVVTVWALKSRLTRLRKLNSELLQVSAGPGPGSCRVQVACRGPFGVAGPG